MKYNFFEHEKYVYPNQKCRTTRFKYLVYFLEEYPELIQKEILEMLYPFKLTIDNFDGTDVEYAKLLLTNSSGTFK